MGSDLYTVSVQAYREHTTEEAIRRLAAYGDRPDGGTFFTGEGPWIEIRLDVRCVHPDAPIGWDPVMVIRWLDEAVYHAARSDDSGFDYQKTPLSERYPEIWKMGMCIDRDEDSVVRVVEVEFRKNPHPREGNASDPYGDTATIVAFVHKKYAPNIAGYDYWESRAWGGGGNLWRSYQGYPETRHPILAEIRPVSPSVRVPPAKHDKYSAIAPRREGGIWAATDTHLFPVTADGGPAAAVLDLLKEHRLSGIDRLAAPPGGAVWMSTRNAVIRRDPAGKATVFQRGQAFDCKKIDCFDASPDGDAYVGATNGLHCLGAGDVWTLVADGLAEKTVSRVTALAGGVAWTAGHRHVTRRNADGTLDRFQSRQGIDSVGRVLALPDGGIWATPWSGAPAYVAPGAGRAVPDELCPRVMPGGLRLGAIGPDGTMWCISMRGYLARLRQGEAPRIYVWEGKDGSLWSDVADLCVSPEGDVWLRLGDGHLAGIRATDFAAADAKPALNADMPHLTRIAPVSFGPAAPPPAAAQAIDFQGKTVVITGTLSKLTRDQAQRTLAERGAVLSDSVNKKTHYLIAGIKPSSKLQKAQSLGIPVLDEDVLLAPAPAAGSTAAASMAAGQNTGGSAAGANAAGAQQQSSATAQAATTQGVIGLVDGVDVARRFPLSDQPAGSTSHLDGAMMRKMAQSKPPVAVKEWKALLKKHKAFLDAGGGNGAWHVLEASGLLLAVFEGYKPDDGEQASLYLRQLPAGFDARKAKLSWMNGCGLFAEGADFCGASLKKSLLCDSSLAGARFDGADLEGVDFSRADLRGASFKKAVLTGADFEGCDLTGADFTGTRVDDARFPGARLSDVKV